jgi:hypothetical protein
MQQPALAESCSTSARAVNNSQSSPIRRARAVSVFRSLKIWSVFRLNAGNVEALASQAEVTPQQCETALDDLARAKFIRFRPDAAHTFVEFVPRASAGSEASK